MATPTEKQSQAPYVPVTTNTNFYRGITPEERRYTGKDSTQDEQHAYNLVEAEYGPQRAAANQQLSRLGRDRQYQTDVLDNFGQRHDDTLSTISDQLQEQLGGITQGTQDRYAGASKVIQDAYNKAGEATQGASDDVLSGLNEQMRRLGVTEAGRDPEADLSQLTTDASGRYATSGAGAVGNIEALGATQTGVAANRQGNAAQDFAGHRADLGNRVMAMANDINRDYNEQRDAVISEIQALEQSRGQAMAGTLKDVIEQRLERERQTRLDTLAEEMSRRGMAVQEGYLGQSGERLGLDRILGMGNLEVAQGHLGVAEGQLGVQRDQLGLQEKQLQAELEAADSPLAELHAQLELERVRSEIENLDAQTGQLQGGELPGVQSQFKGLEGTRQYLQQAFPDNPNVSNMLEQEFNSIVAEARDIESNTSEGFESALYSLVNAAESPIQQKIFNELAHIYNNDHASFAE